MSGPRAYCVAVLAKAGGPCAASMPPVEVRRWTTDDAEAFRWQAAAPGARLMSFDAQQAETLPPKLRAEALAHLGLA